MIRARLYAFDKLFAALSLRERVFIAIAISGLFLMAAQWLFFAPTIAAIRAEKKQQQEVGIQREQLLQELANAQALAAQRGALAPGVEGEVQLAALNRDLSALASALVPPDKMAELLRTVLTEHSGLQLFELLKLPVLPIEAAGSVLNAGPSATEQAVTTAAPAVAHPAVLTLYQHKLQLRLRGSYGDTLRYLQALEQSGWRLYWHSLDYQVDTYPNALVTIELATLSQDEGWIGG